MLRKELQYFLTALMFYTRIPVGEIKGWQDEFLYKSRKYFPVIGWIVGGLSAAIFYALSLILPQSVSIVMAMMSSLLLTGAFHEDGLADSCDAFGGGWSTEQVLSIMKDSRIGTYGSVALIFSFALKLLSLIELAKYSTSLLILALIFAHVLSRYMALSMMQIADYVQEGEKSKSKTMASNKLTKLDFLIASLFAVPALFLWAEVYQAIIVVPMFLATLYLRRYFIRRIGGYTGDALGMTQQVTELIAYLGLLVLARFC